MTIKKRLAALGAAMVMGLSMMSMGASATSYTFNKTIAGISTNCTANNTGNYIYVSTSPSGGTASTTVSASATYKHNGSYVSVGNGNGGKGGCSTSVSKASGSTWYSLSTTHGVSSSTKTISNASWKNVGVI